MSGFVEGVPRDQVTLFPDCLDDFVGADSAVRVVDAFVARLDLKALGFSTEAAATGRPGYHPGMLLKLFIYGYLNQLTSSRRLEREAGRNVEVMWLTGRLAPDFKTIADFRRDHGAAIQRVCRDFVLVCARIGLFAGAAVAVDGSKFKAVNNRDKNFTPAKLERRRKELEDAVARYLKQIESADRQAPAVAEGRVAHFEQKIAALKAQMAKLEPIAAALEQSEDGQVSLTDPDARSMPHRGGGIVGYNVQTAVDTNSHMIIAHDVVLTGSDRHQLHAMATKAKAVLGVERLDVTADRGYYTGQELKACEDDDVAASVPRPLTSSNQHDGLFGKQDFVYDSGADEYLCPAGERLTYRFTSEEAGNQIRRYWTSACGQCPLKANCTTGKQRRVSRWEHEDVLERVQDRLDRNPTAMRVRRATVEHTFGTLKAWMGYTHFRMKTKAHVTTEFSLHALAYNLKRAIALIGTGPLIEVLTG
jgi:transposase